MTGLEIAIPIASKIADKLADGALERLLKLRLQQGQEVLARRIAKGRPWLISEDETAAALFTYLRATQEGAARVNLDLMAEALVASAQEPTFAPDTFRKRATALADLSRDEILMLAAFVRVNDHAVREAERLGHPENVRSIAWTCLLHSAPSDFPPGFDVIATASALGRTGWVAPASGYGALVFYTTPAFDDVARLVNLRAAAAAEASC